jgi:hypothetical protein
VSKTLIPEESFSTSVKLVKMKLLDNLRVRGFHMVIERMEERIFFIFRFGDGIAKDRGCSGLLCR